MPEDRSTYVAPTGDVAAEASWWSELAPALAERHSTSTGPGAHTSPVDLLAGWQELLRGAYERFAQTTEVEAETSAVGEWLLDNFYVVQQAVRQIREDMPAGYNRRLPKLDQGPLQGYARVYDLGREIVQRTGGNLRIDQVTRLLQLYQQTRPLTMGELWAVPTMLRLGIVELLSQVVARAVRVKEEEGGAVPEVVALPDNTPDEQIVANGMGSLRTLATQDWKEFFEANSHVEQVLRQDPAGAYARMDFATRDRYRQALEQIAEWTGREEEAVAQETIMLTRQAGGSSDSDQRVQHVGFYLVDSGRRQLETRLGYRPAPLVRLQRWLPDHPTTLYLGGIGLLALAIAAGLVGYALDVDGTAAQVLVVGLLALVPALGVAVNLVNLVVTRVVPPRVLPKMDYSEGLPADCQAIVVIPSLIADAQEIRFLLQQLEQHHLNNADPNLRFALLGDFADAPDRHRPEDQLLLERVVQGIQSLNRKYGQGAAGPFYFFHRERQWNPGEGSWMAWERKRGNLVEFSRLLTGRGDETSYTTRFGDLGALSRICYVITLDADTVLPWGAAQRLVGTMAHPLNRPVFDPQSGAAVSGYTVLQPRVEVKPTSVNQSLFTRTFAGDAGLDLYTLAVSDVYQDLFGEGSFVGKGIYDIRGFQRSIAGRVPENALLSHDLFEGILGRAGLVTDIVLYEDFPPDYLSYAQRLHRWVRGDWQLLPWLLPRVPRAGSGRTRNDLSVLDRWKIVDNLRRSLGGPALLFLLALGWLWLPRPALFWTLVALLAAAVPLAAGLVIEVRRRLRTQTPYIAAPALRAAVLRWLLSLAFLPYEAVLMLDAIVRTLVRLLVTRRHLLEWTTAAHTVRLFRGEHRPTQVWQRKGSAPVLALVLLVLLGLFRPAALLIAAPFVVAWLMFPLLALWVSRRIVYAPAELTVEQRRQLRSLARRTWHYFERFVGPEDHWLPPDHFQEEPRGQAAHRTSPTNVGLLLLSSLAAYDLGYVGPLGLSLRLRSSFETMAKMERYRGHFLNWYDTSSLQPLSPRYVSTVDSGNLAGCLLTLRQGLQTLPQQPVLRWQQWQGLLDTLDVLGEVIHGAGVGPRQATALSLRRHLEQMRQQVLAVKDSPERWLDLLDGLLRSGWQEVERSLLQLVEEEAERLETAALGDLRAWSEQAQHHLRNMRNEVNSLASWAALAREPLTPPEAPAARQAWEDLRQALPAAPRLSEVVEICHKAGERLARLRELLVGDTHTEAVQSWCEQLEKSLHDSQKNAADLLQQLQLLADSANAYCQEASFSFLFDSRRGVFYLGYDLATGGLDRNHYDLLASEARTASLVAMAKGDVPRSHWLYLDRPLTRVNGRLVLLSWNGSMFEYLMPALLMRNYAGTLLDETCHAVVERQIAYAESKGIPWGISESSYYAFDANQNYQYKGFGVPGLGRKRGLGEELVIAPYASLLALSLHPGAVTENISALIQDGMLGRYGFYEAADYTRSRLPLGQKRAIVRSYMAHHQGMILLSATNYLEHEAMVRRFHADPRVQSVDLLLQERLPYVVPVEQVPEQAVRVAQPVRRRTRVAPWRAPPDSPAPCVHFLSNGRYGVLITDSGAGYSSYAARRSGDRPALALTRWRSDTTLDDWGVWLYVQDRDSGALWSATDQPTGISPQAREVLFSPQKAEFRRLYNDIMIQLEIAVAPEDDVEVRYLRLVNQGTRRRRLRLSSYGEVVLAPLATDRQHAAFSKLFVQSEFVPELAAQVFYRRPRSAEEQPLYMVHMVVAAGPGRWVAWEGDRARFLGRGGTVRRPAALAGGDGGWAGSSGATLDPIMALRQEVAIAAQGRVEVAYVTLVAESRKEALKLAGRYRDLATLRRTVQRACAQGEEELRALDMDGEELQRIEDLLSIVLYPCPALRAAPATIAANRLDQSGLWAQAISGDYPILLVQIGTEGGLALAQELLRAHRYWRERGIEVDLVILNQRDYGYAQELQEHLQRLLRLTGSDAWANRRGGIFLLRAAQMGEADRILLQTAARAVLDETRGSLAEQLAPLRQRTATLPRFSPTGRPPEEQPTPLLERPAGLRFGNGLGGFSADGREYIIYLEPDQWTPAPWVNVIANPHFGFLVSEAGSSSTWAVNSGENRLTPWSNDPVADPSGEALYLRDEETGQVWSPTPGPTREAAPYLVRHGAGYSVFEHHSHGLKQRLRLFAVPDAPVKVVQLRLENAWDHGRRITATFYAEWVLGTNRETTVPYTVPEFDVQTQSLLARNPYRGEFAEQVAFLSANKRAHGMTADRAEFLGRLGNRQQPAALERVGLAGAAAAGHDPCAAIQLHLDLPAGGAEEVYFLLGQGAGREQALQLARQYQDPAQVEQAWAALGAFWDGLLGAVTVQTPDPAMDVLLNRWLLYQALSCRLWARSALYQSSGAFGFRDQLQDVMALLHAAPHLAREHILEAARHQFEAGDVLHWWHPPSGRGVRTRISDNLLWLPFVTAHYVATTGDAAILHEKVPFLQGDPLRPDEAERYAQFPMTGDSYSLYEHCCRALSKGSTRGPRGLPLIGAGDWNDGLSRVGRAGRGESVWLGWFLCATLLHFAPLCEQMADKERATAYRKQAEELRQTIEVYGWDGAWYRRGYYDDGTALGSIANQECQIDSLAQSWAVLSGVGEPQRAKQAMQAVDERLLQEKDGLLLLFTPPFDKTLQDPGYVKGYPPGIRENGGQYTHAALWAAWAFAELGEGDHAVTLWQMLNPIHHGDSAEKAGRYRVEPYAVAADVYSVTPHVGRGGWTWYTGSAGWMYRLGLEAILGLRRAGASLEIRPCIPRGWSEYTITYRYHSASYKVRVKNPRGVNRGVEQVTLDGKVLPDGRVPLVDDGVEHRVEVVMGSAAVVPGAPAGET